MGACEFYDIMKSNDDIQTTFRHGVEMAAYEHGHGGYSGTLAEKCDLVVFVPAKASLSTARFSELLDQMGRNRWKNPDRYNPHPEPDDAVTPDQLRMLKHAFAVAEDKWGPAAGMELDAEDPRREERWESYPYRVQGEEPPEHVYVFWGEASS